MVLSAVSSTSYRRTVNPSADGQARREGHQGQLFSLQQREVANDEVNTTGIQQTTRKIIQPPVSPIALEKWLRLMGAARQMAYQGGDQATMQGEAANMRYRLQRTYFDQEHQVTPQTAAHPDPRLQAYRDIAIADNGRRRLDFVV